VKFHEDDRAQRIIDVFPHLDGQINISHVNSTSHVVAWHKHEIQSDFWFCVKGSFKVGLAEPNGKEAGKKHDVRFEYLSDKVPKLLHIPPGIYHGYKALEPGSIMLYYLSEKYNPEDEHRASVGDFNECWDTENK
jgi:dTDP-4-dehydrorhamnose 3,5-epimerase-like enzyme